MLIIVQSTNNIIILLFLFRPFLCTCTGLYCVYLCASADAIEGQGDASGWGAYLHRWTGLS